MSVSAMATSRSEEIAGREPQINLFAPESAKRFAERTLVTQIRNANAKL